MCGHKFPSSCMCQSYVCLERGAEVEFRFPFPPGPLASGLPALHLPLCDSLTERRESFLFQLREVQLPARLLVNRFSSFYLTLYFSWFTEPSWVRGKAECWGTGVKGVRQREKGQRSVGSRVRPDEQTGCLAVPALEKLPLGTPSVKVKKRWRTSRFMCLRRFWELCCSALANSVYFCG